MKQFQLIPASAAAAMAFYSKDDGSIVFRFDTNADVRSPYSVFRI